MKESFNSSIPAKLTGWEIPEGYLEFIFGEMTEDEMDTLQPAGALFAGALSLGVVKQGGMRCRISCRK